MPIRLAAAISGVRRRDANRSPACLGLALTLAGPIVLAATVALIAAFR